VGTTLGVREVSASEGGGGGMIGPSDLGASGGVSGASYEVTRVIL